MLAWLHLLQIADSAIPIGGTAHSFGLEMLVADALLTVSGLHDFFSDYLQETGTLDAAYCRAANRLVAVADGVDRAYPLPEWLTLNYRLDALKSSRETRQASAALGRRFLQLAADLDDFPLLSAALAESKRQGAPIHHCAAFGLGAGAMGIDATTAAASYLHQSIAGLISACQRLMPLGQNAASKLLWALKPAIQAAAEYHADDDPQVHLTLTASTPLIELASQRHPTLTTRLFIS